MVDTEKFLDKAGELSTIRTFWKADLHERNISQYDSYIAFYEKEWYHQNRQHPWEIEFSGGTAAATSEEVTDIVMILSEHRDVRLRDVRPVIQDKFPTHPDEAVDNAIHFVLRAWLTLNVRNKSQQLLAPHSPVLQWNDDESLMDFVSDQFPNRSGWKIDPSECRFGRYFTATYLSQACGLEIEWTDFISDHLLLNDDRTTLQVYHFKLCAFNHFKKSGSSLKRGAILPEQMLQEIIWSLNLLFPDDKPTNKFLRDRNMAFLYDAVPDNRRPQDLNDYIYLRERLFHLRQLYEAEPENFWQLWFKRQGYGTRFQILATIGLGFLLALFLGIISSVTAIISTRATLKGLAVSEEGLRVAQEALALQKQVLICPCSP